MKKIDWKAEIIDFLKTLVISFIVIFIITRFVVRPVRVNQNSMYPTVLDQSLGLSNIFSIAVLNDIDRFDIVVVKTDDGKNLIKRVVGLPNETIEYRNDVLYVDGVAIEEDFLDDAYKTEQIKKLGLFTDDIESITLAEDEIYCLGDNRPFSRDSRDYGPFKVSQAMGKDLFVLYPFERFGNTK